MPPSAQMRHRGATRPSSLKGARSRVVQDPGRANDFRRKCSEYTGPARRLRLRLSTAIARGLP